MCDAGDSFPCILFKHLTLLADIQPVVDGVVGRSLGRKEMFYLTTHSTHFIYGYMASDMW